MTYSPRLCAKCGVPFTPKREWQKFHSNECRTTYHKQMRDISQELITKTLDAARIHDPELRRAAFDKMAVALTGGK